MGPIKCAYDLRETANVQKFLYGLPSFGLGLGKFHKIVRSSQQGSAEFVLYIHSSASTDSKG